MFKNKGYTFFMYCLAVTIHRSTYCWKIIKQIIYTIYWGNWLHISMRIIHYLVIFVRYVIIWFVILCHLQQLEYSSPLFLMRFVSSLFHFCGLHDRFLPFILRGSVDIFTFKTYRQSNFLKYKLWFWKDDL